MTQEPTIDIQAVIVGDLLRAQRRRRRHFLPALLLVLLFTGGSLAMIGVRSDLLHQPPWQLALQLALWILCLLVFPAIGLGLLFPLRATRITLAIAGVVMTIAAVMGPELGGFADLKAHLASDEHGIGCGIYLVTTGLVILGIGALSGAFIQRRRPAAIYWITAGITLAALNLLTWHCPATGVAHLVPGHLGGATVLLLLASVVALLAHASHRASEHPPGS